MQDTITLNKSTLRKLKLAYNKANSNGEARFKITIEGIEREFVTKFAHYFIEFAEGKISGKY